MDGTLPWCIGEEILKREIFRLDGRNGDEDVGQWHGDDIGVGYDIVLMADRDAQRPCL